ESQFSATMNSLTKDVEVLRLSKDASRRTHAAVVQEIPLTIFLNDREIVTLLCTGAHVESLAVGFLKSEGLLQNRKKIKSVVADEGDQTVRVFTSENTEMAEQLFGKRTITSGCGKGTVFYNVLDSLQSKPLENQLTISAAQIRQLMAELQRRSELYRRSRGVHNCALATPEQILIFRTDIGRHNAVDMIFGECFLQGVRTDDKILVTTGRITSEILIKAAKMQIPVLISRSAATSLSLELAQSLNMAVIGYVRGGSILVYTGDGNLVY
ncbi:MAG: formate dehydrogenase accessory sulfurtransferase FdhD, partial [Deltaproteobacteria bacterium]